jgi:hypothetical protein
MRSITVLDAPSNLGLRAPAPGLIPGCYKLAGALRDQRLVERLGAGDAGVVVPPRYDARAWRPGDGVMNADAIAMYTRRLADRVGAIIDRAEFLLLLGGTARSCSGPRSRCGAVVGTASSTLMVRLTFGTSATASLSGHPPARARPSSPVVANPISLTSTASRPTAVTMTW